MSLGSAFRILCGVALLGVVGCEGASVEEAKPAVPNEQTDKLRQRYGTVTGDEGLVLFSTRPRNDQNGGGGGGPGIGVNVFLWRAALETIDFMPLVQADPFGGVIITDWYSPTGNPDERFKLTVYILDRVLRADAVKVSVFRQTRSENGWVDAQVERTTAIGIEDSVLTRARELRIAALGPAES
jgi:hypothetical protein